jgi:hypothetical protein
MTGQKLHSGHQSAYKENFSTETAICWLMNQLLWAMERGEVSILVALDLSAAFDTVDYDILCDVLRNKFGIHDTALNWTKSYLRDRKLQVQIGEATSSVKCFHKVVV